MKKMTIKDIAEKAGVSKATVSRVLNHQEIVDVKTRERVLAAIKQYDYSPSLVARGLSTRSSSTIGIIIPEIDNPFYSLLLRQILTRVTAAGLTAICFDTDNVAKQDLRALQLMEDNRVAGAIYASALEYGGEAMVKKGIACLKSLSFPVVLLDRELPEINIDRVLYQNQKAIYMATTILLKAGYRDIALVGGSQAIIFGRERRAGFIEALQEFDLPVREERIIEGDFTQKTAYCVSKNLLESASLPTAVITCNNSSALGYLEAYTERNDLPPIAHIGMDELHTLDAMHIEYNHIKRHVEEMGSKAFEVLCDRMQTPDAPKQRICLEPTFVLEENLYNIAQKEGFCAERPKERENK